jgi:hypothetical protein
MQTQTESIQSKNLRASKLRSSEVGDVKVNQTATKLSSARKRREFGGVGRIVKRARLTTFSE